MNSQTSWEEQEQIFQKSLDVLYDKHKLELEEVRKQESQKMADAIEMSKQGWKDEGYREGVEAAIKEIPDTIVFQSMKTNENVVKDMVDIKQQLKSKLLPAKL